MAEAAENETLSSLNALEQTISSRESQRPADVFLQGLTGGIRTEQVQNMVHDQLHMLSRFEKTNEMLLNFNDLSESRYVSTQGDFLRHTQQLTSMKADLESVFRRIRLLKSTLSRQYPEAFAACSNVYNVIEDEEEESSTQSTSAVPQ